VSHTPRLRAALALLWYLAVGVGLPLADGLLFHDQDAPRTAHVESSDTRCHRAECSLEAPGAPQSPAGGPLVAPRVVAVTFVNPPINALQDPRSRSLARAHAPRAPPQFT
jgi:hypothetical protein